MPNTLGGYEIIREIARSNDIVYEARDPAMNRRVALKELALAPNLVGEQRRERIERFYREARAAGNLAHPHIVTVFKVGEEMGRHFIAMEFLEGDTLRSMLQVGGPLPVHRAVEICAQICDALDYAHQRGVIHRDVKPDNIQILPDGAAKLTDFGIARLGGEPGITQAGQVFGTPSYMSPEQIAGKPVDQRSDVFAMGVVLYEILTGRKPFTGDSVVTITYNIMNMDPAPPPGVPGHLQQIIRKAMAKAPEQRFQSAAEMARDLRLPAPPPQPFAGTQHVGAMQGSGGFPPLGGSPAQSTASGPFGSPFASPFGSPPPAAAPSPFGTGGPPSWNGAAPSYSSSAAPGQGTFGPPAAFAPGAYGAPPASSPPQLSSMPVLPPLPPPAPGLREFFANQGPFLSLLAIVLVLMGMGILVFWAISSGYDQAPKTAPGAGMSMAPPVQPGAGLPSGAPPAAYPGSSPAGPGQPTGSGAVPADNSSSAYPPSRDMTTAGASGNSVPPGAPGGLTAGPGEPSSGNESEAQRAQDIRGYYLAGMLAERQSNREQAITDYNQAINLYNRPWAGTVPPDLGPVYQNAQQKLNDLTGQ